MAKIYKDKQSNTYYFSASLGNDSITGKRIRKVKRGFKTEKEAKQAYHEYMSDYGKMAFKSNSTMTYREFYQTIFLPWYQTRVKQRTYENRLSAMNLHFQYFFNLKVSEISPLQIQIWQSTLTKKLNGSYVRSIFGLFSMSLERAYLLGMVPNNQAKLVGNVKKIKTTVDFWTKTEFEKVISTFNLQDYYQYFEFINIWLLFMTGLRFGEAQALQWDTDIDFENKTLNINKTLYYKNSTSYEFVDPKTRASIRVIALDEDTIHYLKEWQSLQNMIGGSKFILSYNGLPTNKHTVSHIIKRHAKLVNVHSIRIHALRHSHASLLISMGENHLIIKDRLGHEDIKTTLGTYGHLYPNSNFDVATKLKGTIVRKENKEFQQNKTKFNGNQFIKKEGI